MSLFSKKESAGDAQERTAERRERLLEIINGDVTNHCNARCFFCFNDWDSFKPLNMSMETFENYLKLQPLMGGTDFMLSCWFEPTINPRFYDMLDLLPEEYKAKTYFTTNLVTKISEENIERMCRANVDHINISLETWDEDEYKSITGVENTHFFENVEKMAIYSKKYGTDLHVITMLTARNAGHFKELVQRVHDTLSPSLHEIRTPYFFIEDTENKEALMKDMLPRKEIDRIVEETNELGYGDLLLWDVRFSRESFESLEKNPQAHVDASNEIYYRLRVNADGKARIGNQKTGTLIDINEPGDLVARVKQELTVLQEKDVSMHQMSMVGLKKKTLQTEKPYWIDSLTIYDGRFLYIRGWDQAFDLASKKKYERVALLECGREKRLVKLRKEYRKDVAEALQSKESDYCGYNGLIDLEGVADKRYTVKTGIIRGEELILIREIYRSKDRFRI